MGKNSIRLNIRTRTRIQMMLDRNRSFAEIARFLGCSRSTVAREVAANSVLVGGRALRCRLADACSESNVCGTCPASTPGECAECRRGCAARCRKYWFHSSCERMNERRWLCNGCPKFENRTCHLPLKRVYDAVRAQEESDRRASSTRKGSHYTPEEMAPICAKISECLDAGLSPAVMLQLHPDEIPLSESTIYAWIDRGYCDLRNIDLLDKVARAPKPKRGPRKATSHSAHRAHSAFGELPEEVRSRAFEMDTVMGSAGSKKCLLTLLHRPSRLQLVVLLPDKTCASVLMALEHVADCCPPALLRKLFRTVLTDNGSEFADEQAIARLFGEAPGTVTRLFYCDPRRSEQKGACERNHRELRRILDGKEVDFDTLTPWDVCAACSHLNSRPRKVLKGKTPIDAFLEETGAEGLEFLDALGIEKVPPHKLRNNPGALDN